MRARTIHKVCPSAGAALSATITAYVAGLEERCGAGAPAAGPAPRRLSFSGNEANPLFRNTGERFVEVGATLGASRREDGRAVVLLDLDQDGALDAVVRNYGRRPLTALLNRGPAGGHLRVRLRGTRSNRFGIGARVRVGGAVQELACGTGYATGNAPELHFGLGAAPRADVEVRWPSGQVDRYAGVPAGHVLTLVEGDPAAARASRPAPIPVDPAGGGARDGAR